MLASIRQFLSRLAGLNGKSRPDAEIDDELRFHLEMQIEANLRQGMSAEEARRRAFIALGGVEKSREEYRQARTLVLLENLAADFRFAWRMIVREPRFSAMLILVLTLGIGCATSMFSVVDRLLLRPVPSPVGNRLITVPTTIGMGRELDYWAQNPALDGITQFHLGDTNLTTGETVERVKTVMVAPNFFPLLEVQPLFGRLFRPEEATAGHEQVVVLSYGTWLQRYGGDRTVLGRSLSLNGISHTIIGVMRSGFRFPPQSEVWVPHVRSGGVLRVDQVDYYTSTYMGGTIGRLRPRATLQQAQAGHAVLLARVVEDEKLKGRRVRVLRLPRGYQDYLADQIRLPLLALFGATGFVLLISCANAANLLLARAAVRRKEIAMRVCLGAGRLRILRQMLTESLLTAMAGGALGALLSFAAVAATRAFGTHYISTLAELSVNGRLLGFALGASVLAGIATGLVPALQSFAPDMSSSLKQEGTRTGGGVRQVVRKSLVAGQVALGVVLVVGAALMLQSLHRLMSVDKGFDEQQVVIGRLTLPLARYKEPQQRAAYWERLQSEVRSVQGVTVTALSVGLPFINLGCGGGALDLGAARGPDKRYLEPVCITASADYFKALGVPLRAGRLFNDSDGPSAPKVMIINEQLARMAWPGQDPIGQQVQIEMEKGMRQVVGVSGNVKFWSLDDRDRPQYYIPYLQPFRASADLRTTPFEARLVVRTASNPEKLIGALQRTVLSVDREVPLLTPQTMEDLILDSAAAPRYRAWLLTGFGLAALLLALLGVYGVVSYSVACRRHELGVRISLGAQRPHILRLIAGEGARVALAGAIVGLLVARALTGLLTKLLFGVAPTDPLTFAAAAVVLVAGALAASLIPALRAARTDPMVALRCE